MLTTYLKKFIPFAVLIAAILFGLQSIDQFAPVMKLAWTCYILFFIMSIVTYYFNARSMREKFSNFMNAFFIGIFAKLVITGIVVVIYKTSNPETSMNFILPFAVIYFSFLIFETLELVKLSKKSK